MHSPNSSSLLAVLPDVFLAAKRRHVRKLALAATLLATGAILVPNQASATPPYAVADYKTCIIGSYCLIPVLYNDSSGSAPLDPGSVDVVTPPQYGAVMVDQNTGEVTYIPQSGFSGTDTFYYTVDNLLGETSNAAQVSVTVQANTAPEFLSFSCTYAGGGLWRFYGSVADEDPSGMIVTLTGLPLASPVQTVVDSSGNFSVMTPIVQSGWVFANTQDEYGVPAEETVTRAGP